MLCCGKPKEPFVCNVELLDGTHITYSKAENIKITTKCQVLLDAVCTRLKLSERDYFGLFYYDIQSTKNWLDPNKAFCDDTIFIKAFHNIPCLLYFGVKFYAVDPCSLKEEISRYQFFLQLKKDLLNGKLHCTWKKAAEVSALSLQSEIGDYHPSEHKRGYVSQFRFLPNQTEKFEIEVSRLHASYKGLIPATAELQFLKRCRQFDLYGVELHPVRGEAGAQFNLGISPKGIETFKDKDKITTFYWPRIKSLDYKDNYLKIEVKTKAESSSFKTFELPTTSTCQRLWKNIVEHHVFYRLPQNVSNLSGNGKYRYSGRTETEILQSEVEREEPEVERVNSKRFPLRSPSPDDDIDGDKENSKVKANGHNGETNWNDVLGKKGMFSKNQATNNSVNYMTPKNERKERNRQLQSLSDTENRNRRHRSRGRSSGDESDSPSKRRIRARARHRSNVASDVSESSQVRRRRRKYYTDTEMTTTLVDHPANRKNIYETPSHSRKSKRISKEDLTARQQLWQHIQRDVVDSYDKTAEELKDIPYTEIKTEGNPYHVKPHHSKRRHSHGKRSGGLSTNSYTQALDEGMIPALPITRAGMQEHHHNHSANRYKSSGKDWDTRTYNSVGNRNQSETRQHRSKNRKSTNSAAQNSSTLSLIYSQV